MILNYELKSRTEKQLSKVDFQCPYQSENSTLPCQMPLIFPTLVFLKIQKQLFWDYCIFPRSVSDRNIYI